MALATEVQSLPIAINVHSPNSPQHTFISINTYTMEPTEYNLPIVALPASQLPQLGPIDVLVDTMPLCPRVVLSIN